MPKYKAAAYIRLSYAADRSNESDSVANQRKLIENFVSRNRRLTSELIHRLIERVEVSHDKRITVTYTFVTDYEHYKEALERCADM